MEYFHNKCYVVTVDLIKMKLSISVLFGSHREPILIDYPKDILTPQNIRQKLLTILTFG
jgi:hypothetical protein